MLNAVLIRLIAFLLWPLLWLLSIPFRLIGITFGAMFALLKAVRCCLHASSVTAGDN